MGNSLRKDWTGIPASEYPVLKNLKRTGKRWKKQQIYRDRYGLYYHRDPLHSEVEVYDRHCDHLRVLTPEGDNHPVKGQDITKSIRKIIR